MGHVSGPPAAPSLGSAVQDGSNEALNPAVKAYREEIVEGALADFLGKSREVGGVVELQVNPHTWTQKVLTCCPVSISDTALLRSNVLLADGFDSRETRLERSRALAQTSSRRDPGDHGGKGQTWAGQGRQGMGRMFERDQ